MKKLKVLLCIAMVTVLFAGMQMAVFAAVTSGNDVSSQVSSPATVDNIQPYANETGNSMNEASAPGTTLYSANNQVPDTGMENLAIPGMVALLAASAAAIALTGKKK